MAGLGGLSKLHSMQGVMKGEPKGTEKPVEQGKVEGESGDAKVHEIHEHPDGHFTSKMHGGAETEHPDHKHMLAHIGHQVTGGDKHHIAHHDGMSISTHGISESGEHEGPQEHNSAEEAKEAFGNFMDEEAQEPEHQGGAEAMPAPAMGGMAG